MGRKVWPWAVPVVALMMLALVLTPAEVWHRRLRTRRHVSMIGYDR